jgi:hypothetical protein
MQDQSGRRASPANFALDGPKPPLGSFTSSRTRPYRKALLSEPGRSARDVVSPEGLRRLLPEPTPSPRLWATAPGATPARLCEHTMRAASQPSKPERSTWLGIGTFYLAPTVVRFSRLGRDAQTGRETP